MILYVATNGSDSNDGLSAEAPLLTIGKAESKLDAPGRHVINLAAGIYDPNALNVRGGHEACVNGVSYRGPAMVARTPSQGPQSEELLEAEAINDAKTRLHFETGGWATDAHLGWFLRIKRGSNRVIFNIPAARNGSDWVELDVGKMLVGGTHLAELLQEGDVCEWVKPAVEIRSDPNAGNLSAIVIKGHGAGSWNFDDGNHPGGLNGPTFSGIAFTGAVFAINAWNISFAECSFDNIDNNFWGGSAHFSNCTSRGMQFQGGWSNQHDHAGCLPDSAESPIYRTLNAPSMELLCKGSIVVGRGGGMSALGASYLAEKNVSAYEATGSRAGIAVVRGSFVANAPSGSSNRLVAVQGDGNGWGVRVTLGGLARLNNISGVAQVSSSGGSDIYLEGANAETWANFLASPISGNLSNSNGGRITTAYP